MKYDIYWHQYRHEETKEHIWWTERDRKTNCFEIRKPNGENKFSLFVNDMFRKNYNDLIPAMKAAEALWSN